MLLITSYLRDTMGISIYGYKAIENNASCGRGTFKVFLDTINETSERLLKNELTDHYYSDFLEELKKKYRVDVLDKLNNYKTISVEWKGDEVNALRDFIDFIDGPYVDTLMKNYKDCPDDLMFYHRHFLRVKHTLDECDMFIIGL